MHVRTVSRIAGRSITLGLGMGAAPRVASALRSRAPSLALAKGRARTYAAADDELFRARGKADEVLERAHRRAEGIARELGSALED